MAFVYIQEGETAYAGVWSSGSYADVKGSSGTERVIIQGNARVDSSVEGIDLAGKFEDYKIYVNGLVAVLTNGNTTIEVSLGDKVAPTIRTTEGAADLKLDISSGSAVVTLGETVITATSAETAVTAAPTKIDATNITLAGTSAGGGGGSGEEVFNLTTAADDLNKSNSPSAVKFVGEVTGSKWSPSSFADTDKLIGSAATNDSLDIKVGGDFAGFGENGYVKSVEILNLAGGTEGGTTNSFSLKGFEGLATVNVTGNINVANVPSNVALNFIDRSTNIDLSKAFASDATGAKISIDGVGRVNGPVTITTPAALTVDVAEGSINYLSNIDTDKIAFTGKGTIQTAQDISKALSGFTGTLDLVIDASTLTSDKVTGDYSKGDYSTNLTVKDIKSALQVETTGVKEFGITGQGSGEQTIFFQSQDVTALNYSSTSGSYKLNSSAIDTINVLGANSVFTVDLGAGPEKLNLNIDKNASLSGSLGALTSTGTKEINIVNNAAAEHDGLTITAKDAVVNITGVKDALDGFDLSGSNVKAVNAKDADVFFKYSTSGSYSLGDISVDGDGDLYIDIANSGVTLSINSLATTNGAVVDIDDLGSGSVAGKIEIASANDVTFEAATLKGLNNAQVNIQNGAGTLNITGTGNENLSGTTLNFASFNKVNYNGSLSVSGGTGTINAAGSHELHLVGDSTKLELKGAGILAVNGSTGSDKVTIESKEIEFGSGAGTITLSGNSGADSFLLDSDTLTAGSGATGAINLNGVETFTIVAGNKLSVDATNGAATLTVSGDASDNNITISADATSSSTLELKASGADASLTISGGDGADTIAINASVISLTDEADGKKATLTIDAGSGNDTILIDAESITLSGSGSSGASLVINAGDGDDTITIDATSLKFAGASGNNAKLDISAGSGDDTINLIGALTIIGGDGTIGGGTSGSKATGYINIAGGSGADTLDISKLDFTNVKYTDSVKTNIGKSGSGQSDAAAIVTDFASGDKIVFASGITAASGESGYITLSGENALTGSSTSIEQNKVYLIKGSGSSDKNFLYVDLGNKGFGDGDILIALNGTGVTIASDDANTITLG